MTYSIEQVKEIVEKLQEEEDFSWGELKYSDDLEYGDVKLTTVDSHGGEGEGDSAWIVFRLNDSEQLFMKDGYYASHYGFDWDGDVYEVEKYQRVVDDYRPV